MQTLLSKVSSCLNKQRVKLESRLVPCMGWQGCGSTRPSLFPHPCSITFLLFPSLRLKNKNKNKLVNKCLHSEIIPGATYPRQSFPSERWLGNLSGRSSPLSAFTDTFGPPLRKLGRNASKFDTHKQMGPS